MDIPKQYDPKEAEQHHYERWERNGFFAPEINKDPQAPVFSIVIPPPNVTGSLHMGHALQHTMMDVMTRHKRMRGFRTLWLPGMDHAGISTQLMVSRALKKEGKSRHDLGREKFVERVWQWKNESGGQITVQMRREGASVDWSREKFTMDEDLSRAVREVFVQLYEAGVDLSRQADRQLVSERPDRALGSRSRKTAAIRKTLLSPVSNKEQRSACDRRNHETGNNARRYRRSR